MPRIKEKKYIYDLRNQIVWFLDMLGLDGVDIGIIIGKDRSVVTRIIQKKPKFWQPLWKKNE